MTIIEKIKQSVEGATGMPFLYHAAGELNELLARCNELPVAYSFLIDSGTIDDVNGRYHERVTLAVMFCDKTEFDFNALENEEIIDRMKVKAYKWLQSLRMSNALHVVSVNNTQRLYDNTTDILTGFAVNITIEDVAGVGECELPQVVIDVDKNGSYDVVGVDKVVVSVLPKLDELEVTRNGEYLPPTDIEGFSKVSVNVLEVGVGDAYTWIKNRLKGSEDGTIPAIPLKEPLDGENLLENLNLLDNRRMDDGLTLTLTDGTKTKSPDGISLAQILCSSAYASYITEIVDTNVGWTMRKSINLGIFPNIKFITIGAKTIDLNNSRLYSGATSVHINLPNATYIYATFPKDKSEIYAPEVESLYQLNGFGEAPQGEVVYMPKLRNVNCNNHYFRWFARDTELPTRKMVFGSLQGKYGLNNWGNCISPNLIHLEFGADGLGGLSISTDTSTWWQPTMALRTDTDAEDYVDLREDMNLENNLQQFLQNFRDYIAERLTDKGSGLTITLSQEVRDAIQQDPEIVSIITSKGWTISPAPSV